MAVMTHDGATCPTCGPAVASDGYRAGLAAAPAPDEYERETAIADPTNRLGPKWWPEGSLEGLPLKKENITT